MAHRVMIFYDFENFKQSLYYRDRNRKFNYGKVQYLIIDLLRNLVKIKDIDRSDLIRAYAYTGEYTPELISKIEKNIEWMEERGFPVQKIESKKERLEKTKEKMSAQRRFMKRMEAYHFFEMRTCPLKYDGRTIFQKGVDVQLAVDLVTHAFRDNYDIAVVCSGDVDLLESLKIVKGLGKMVIVISHPDITADAIIKEADFYIDVSKLSDEDLDKITFVERGGERE